MNNINNDHADQFMEQSHIKILFLSGKSKLDIIKNLGDALGKYDVEYKIFDIANLSGKFPSKNISRWFTYDREFKKTVKEFKPDYICTRSPHYLLTPMLKTGIPTVVWFMGNTWVEIESRKLRKSFKGRLVLSLVMNDLIKIIKKTSIVLSASDYINNEVNKRYPGRSKTLHLGIDSDTWYHVEGMKLKHPCVGLLQAANIYDKVTEMLTLEKVLEALPDVTFYWGGGGPHQDMILDALTRYDNFIHLGKLPYPDGARQYISEIDIYMLSSGLDVFPMSVLEAQLMQKPVIVTNVGGVPEEIQDGKTGFLVEKGNPDQIIEKIKILLDDPQKAKEMGEAGRRFVEENYNWDRIAKEFIDILRSYKSGHN